MKQFFFLYITPFLLAVAIVSTIIYKINPDRFLFDSATSENSSSIPTNYIYNFNENKHLESLFLNGENNTIYLLGSSELTHHSDAMPYNFIPNHFNKRVIGIGHDGNQCFSIFCQLLAKADKLNNATVVIILSPGWFESKPSKGTSSSVFLEFNSESFLQNILTDQTNFEFKNYACKRIASFYHEYNSPHVAFRQSFLTSRSSLSSFHKACCYPLMVWNNYLTDVKQKISISENYFSSNTSVKNTKTGISKTNWDSLFDQSKTKTLSNATNNNWGIDNNYYNEYIHGKTGHTQPVSETNNQELQDFKILLKLLHKKNVKASFIVSPLNPYYYTHLAELNSTISSITSELNKYAFPYLNLFTSDTSSYEKALLKDVMHMSDHGWYKVNRFIIDTYQLTP